jgi:hypothetical protein
LKYLLCGGSFDLFAVASNDTLYGSDPKFFAEVNRVCAIVVDEILTQLRTLDDRSTYNKQVQFLALEVAQFLILIVCRLVFRWSFSRE